MGAQLHRRIVLTVAAGALIGALESTSAWARTRPIMILAYQNTTPGETDSWFGEGIAETLFVASQGTAQLLPISRQRIAQAMQGAGADLQTAPVERAVLPVARSLRAESVFYGEYRRTEEGGLSLTPKLLDVRSGETTALEPVVAGPGRLLEVQSELIGAYARVLRLALKADELQRLVAAARPTTSTTAFEAYAKGRRAALRGTPEGNEGAAELLARAVELDPTFGLAQYQLGVTHMALGNRWKAAAQFRATTQVDTTLPEPFKALGDIFMSSPRRLYDQAIEAYQRALTLRPHYAEAHVGLGDAKGAKGDHEGAIGHYQKALAFDPLNARVHFSLGRIYYGEKNLYFEAVQAYKKAIDLDPYFLEARMGLGEMYEEKGLYKDAIAEYRKVIETDARHTGAHYNLALAYERVDVREAIAAWERYIQVASGNASEKDWIDTARQHLRKLREKLPPQ